MLNDGIKYAVLGSNVHSHLIVSIFVIALYKAQHSLHLVKTGAC